uniref:Alkylated DNA repair protein AlkB homologue 8 N-terminal domain-containing protein n=1 Tax=Knipowitschia caucasica TaxID=637954 RepID=A0AAV2LSS7_KNICA
MQENKRNAAPRPLSSAPQPWLTLVDRLWSSSASSKSISQSLPSPHYHEETIMVFHDSVKLIKFADDTTLIGLISNNDESAYRREVDRLVSWCSGNNLELNAQKTVEMIVDFRKSTVPPPPPSVMDSPITSVESFRFLGTTITQDLKWEPTISSLIKKAQQRMYFLRQLRKAKLPAQMLVQFYTAIIESILTSSVTVWFAGATVGD